MILPERGAETGPGRPSRPTDSERLTCHALEALILCDAIRLELGRPRHGWIRVTLVAGDQSWTWHASDVLNDPVLEIVEVLRATATPSNEKLRVCLWEEPSGYVLDFEILSSTEVVELTIASSDDLTPPVSGWDLKPVTKVQVDRAKLYRTLMSAISSFLEAHAAAVNEHWSKATSVTAYREPLAAARLAWKTARKQ